MTELKDAMIEAEKRVRIDGLKTKSKINIENYKSQVEKEFNDLVEHVFTGCMIETVLYSQYLGHVVNVLGHGTFNDYLDSWRKSGSVVIRSYVQERAHIAKMNGKVLGPDHFTEVLILFLQELALSQALQKIKDPELRNILKS